MTTKEDLGSIYKKYENNEPISREEREAFHTWLKNSVRSLSPKPGAVKTPETKITKIRRRIMYWEYAMILIVLFAIGYSIYLLI